MRRITIGGIIVGLGLLVACCSSATSPTPTGEDGFPPSAAELIFNEKGEVVMPKGYRSWVHVATTWEPIGPNIFDGTTTKTPEFHHVYVEPSAYRAYMMTGEWQDRSLIVKEFTITSTSDKCDDAPAHICESEYGEGLFQKGIFQNGYTRIGVMLKDKQRFPDEPGNWAYFSYGHLPQPDAELSPARSRNQCAQCHVDNAGPKNDYVFSSVRGGLSRVGVDAKKNLSASLPDPVFGASPSGTAPVTITEDMNVTAHTTARLSPEQQKQQQLIAKSHPSISLIVKQLKKGAVLTADQTYFVRDGKADVQVWLTNKAPETIAQLRQLGFETVLDDPTTAKMVIGRLPVTKLAALAELTQVRYVAPQV